MEANIIKKSLRVQRIVLLLGLLLLVGKFIAWWWTNSNAILSDALESIVNIVAGGFALYSIYLSTRPRDANHPYGHGKIEFLSAGFEGALIFIAGIAMIAKGVYNLIDPQPIQKLDFGLYLVTAAGLVNFLLGRWLVRTGKKYHSLVLEADGRHLETDAYTSVGLLIGLVLLMITGWVWIDSVTAILFSIFIMFTGFRLMRTSLAGIMDEADTLLITEIVKRLNEGRKENWIDLHNFRVIKYGATLHIDCHLTLPYYFELSKVDEESNAFERLVEESCDQAVELFVHVDPCEPPGSCKICSKSDCPVRKHTFEGKIEWKLRNITGEHKHHKAAD